MKETLQEERVEGACSKEAMKKIAAKACHQIDISHRYGDVKSWPLLLNVSRQNKQVQIHLYSLAFVNS